jgi:hypothetical protein
MWAGRTAHLVKVMDCRLKGTGADPRLSRLQKALNISDDKFINDR